MKKIFCILIAISAVTVAVPNETDGLLSTALHFVKECGQKSMYLCMKVSYCVLKVYFNV